MTHHELLSVEHRRNGELISETETCTDLVGQVLDDLEDDVLDGDTVTIRSWSVLRV